MGGEINNGTDFVFQRFRINKTPSPSVIYNVNDKCLDHLIKSSGGLQSNYDVTASPYSCAAQNCRISVRKKLYHVFVYSQICMHSCRLYNKFLP